MKEPDSETNSIHQLRTGAPQSGGWDLSELQRFWQALGAWEAVNVDGGDVTQMTYRRADGRVVLIPPRWASDQNRVLLPEDLSTPIQGGTLMYFAVRESPARAR